MNLDNGTILLVADGTKMLLLRNQGDAQYPNLKVIEHHAFENPPNREVMSDAPGVGHTTGYHGRATFEEADPHQDNEDRFAAEAARALDRTAREHQGDIIVVAPPDTLGELRRHYGSEVRARLVGEVAKDLTKHPVAEIERLILSYGA